MKKQKTGSSHNRRKKSSKTNHSSQSTTVARVIPKQKKSIEDSRAIVLFESMIKEQIAKENIPTPELELFSNYLIAQEAIRYIESIHSLNKYEAKLRFLNQPHIAITNEQKRAVSSLRHILLMMKDEAPRASNKMIRDELNNHVKDYETIMGHALNTLAEKYPKAWQHCLITSKKHVKIHPLTSDEIQKPIPISTEVEIEDVFERLLLA